MTLIEVLFLYKDLVYMEGRKNANEWMYAACDESIWWHIENTVNDVGQFIDSDRKPITVSRGKFKLEGGKIVVIL